MLRLDDRVKDDITLCAKKLWIMYGMKEEKEKESKG